MRDLDVASPLGPSLGGPALAAHSCRRERRKPQINARCVSCGTCKAAWQSIRSCPRCPAVLHGILQRRQSTPPMVPAAHLRLFANSTSSRRLHRYGPSGRDSREHAATARRVSCSQAGHSRGELAGRAQRLASVQSEGARLGAAAELSLASAAACMRPARGVGGGGWGRAHGRAGASSRPAQAKRAGLYLRQPRQHPGQALHALVAAGHARTGAGAGRGSCAPSTLHARQLPLAPPGWRLVRARG